MVNTVQNQYDTATTITVDQASQIYQEKVQKVTTISSVIEEIERPVYKAIQIRKPVNSRKWSISETQYFFSLLEIVGIDFSLMAQLQVRRSKKELLNKYKKQYKKDASRIKNVLNKLHWSASYLKVELVKDYKV